MFDRTIGTTLAISFVIIALALGASAADAAVEDIDTSSWNFALYIDDRKVGYHSYELTNSGGVSTLTSEARFNVKLLFVTLYQYQHSNHEIWSDGCLVQIESSTDANGKVTAVDGQIEGGGFELNTKVNEDSHSDCVKSFAYWNPKLLDSPHLLNPQTGKIVPVTFALAGAESVIINNENVPAERYRLKTDEVDIDVWYADGDRWIGLQSTTKEGRIICYELI